MRAIYMQIAFIVACNQSPAAAPVAVSAPDAASELRADSGFVSDSAPTPAPTPDAAVGVAVSVVAPIVPPVPAFEMGMMDHARVFGFSDDGKTLGYCGVFGGKPIVRCGLSTSGNSVVEDHDDKTAQASAMVAKAKALGIGNKHDVRWSYAELEITWSATFGDPTLDVPKAGSLHVGLRKKGEPASYVLDISGAAYLSGWHPEFIGLSPDGATLGVIGHGFGGEYSDTFVIKTIAVNVAAGRAYNDAGYAHHKKGDWAAAATLFRRAIDVDSTHPRARYNLACALARQRDPKTQDALKDAIARDGAVKARAAKDPDFDAVRTETWFEPLVAP